MAKVSAVQRDLKRRKMVAKNAEKRAKLKAIVMNKELPMEERFQATLKLADMSPDTSRTRLRNRCGVTGRPRAFHGKFKVCRIVLRDLAARGELPGVKKASW